MAWLAGLPPVLFIILITFFAFVFLLLLYFVMQIADQLSAQEEKVWTVWCKG
jgi:phage shock protein PspC (stress-responsive transcriptional regulator)